MDSFNHAIAVLGIVWIAFLYTSAAVSLYLTRGYWIGEWPNPRTMLIGAISFVTSFFVFLVIGKIAALAMGLPV